MEDEAGPELQERLREAIEDLARLEGDVAVRYERVERVVDGKAQVREHGSPYLFDPELGVTRLAGDGGTGLWGRVRTYDITRGTADGVVEYVERVVVLPGGTPAAPAPEPTRQRLADLVSEEERASDPKGAVRYEVVVYLREAPGDRIPPRDAVGHDVRYGGRDRAGDLRSELLERRARCRVRMGEDLGRWVERRGGEVRARLPHGLHAVPCAVHADTLDELLDHPDVREVRRTSVPRAGRKDAPSEFYLCNGAERYRDWDEDKSSCSGDKAGYLDARLAAVNAYVYLDRGIQGAGAELDSALGASWAVSDEPADGGGVDVGLHHVSLAIVETDALLFAQHAAFANGATGDLRVDFLQGAPMAFHAGENPSDHATNLAGVALGNITDGQDTRITGATAQDARSGVARRAMGVFSWMPIDETLSDLASTRPVDVVLQAETLNSGDVDHECPTEEEQRGLDVNAQAVVHAFLEDSFLYVKSAGNRHPVDGACASTSEVSAPGGAAVALAVGNLAAGDKTAQEMQSSGVLNKNSSEGATSDGRTYPMLVAPGAGCGIPYGLYEHDTGSQYLDYDQVPTFLGPGGYDYFKGTSAASATVAGCALLFKHWYLAHYPGQANVPGRLLCNLLNMADGYVGGGADVPASGWGLGRFRLRLFEPDGMSGDWARATTSVDLEDGGQEQINLGSILEDRTRGGGSGAKGEVPVKAKRLRITIWWLEPNTGDGEDKADIQAYLMWTRANGSPASSMIDNGGNNVLRLQYESNVPSGTMTLTLSGRIPSARRYITGTRRTLYVSWFWECGPDLSLITCSPGPGDDPPRGVQAQDAVTLGRAGPSTPSGDRIPVTEAEAVRVIDAVRRHQQERVVLRPGSSDRALLGAVQVRS